MKAPACPYRKAVVLGAGGFIGINLVNALVERGFEVVCFDRAPSPHWPRQVKTLVGEFAELPPALLREMESAVVYHLVSSCKPSNSTVAAQEEVRADLLTTVRYLDATVGRRVRWVFLSSGGTVYGHSNAERIGEDHPTNPICTYGAVKLAIEKYFGIYGLLHGLDHVIVRLSNPFGPWQFPGRGQGLVANLLARALAKQPIQIWGDGTQVRDYVYIADAIEGVIQASLRADPGAVYNVGSGQGRSITDLIDLMRQELRVTPPVEHVEGRSSDVKRNVLDCRKIETELGWTPKVDITEGMRHTYEWVRSNA